MKAALLPCYVWDDLPIIEATEQGCNVAAELVERVLCKLPIWRHPYEKAFEPCSRLHLEGEHGMPRQNQCGDVGETSAFVAMQRVRHAPLQFCFRNIFEHRMVRPQASILSPEVQTSITSPKQQRRICMVNPLRHAHRINQRKLLHDNTRVMLWTSSSDIDVCGIKETPPLCFSCPQPGVVARVQLAFLGFAGRSRSRAEGVCLSRRRGSTPHFAVRRYIIAWCNIQTTQKSCTQQL